MTRLFYLVAGFVVGAACVIVSLKYHILQTADGLTMVPKQSASLQETYVDIRKFGIADWMEHRTLAAALIAAKKEHLMQTSVANTWKGQFNQMIEGVQK